MVDTRSAKIIDFPDLPPKGSRSYGGGKRALLGPEIGTLPRSIWGRDCSPITSLRRRRCVRLWLKIPANIQRGILRPCYLAMAPARLLKWS